MVALFTLFVILFTSILIVKIASKILVLTGLSEEVAKFQAKSALTGTGFTTTEAENMITHPLRRRVISYLMTISNVGIVSIIATSVLSFIDIKTAEEGFTRIAIASLIFLSVFLLGKNQRLDQWVNNKIKKHLGRYSSIELADYANLLHIGDTFGIGEIYVEANHWFKNKTIHELALEREGLIVLGIQTPSGEYLGLPSKIYLINQGDTVILYGRADMLRKISERTADFTPKEKRDTLDSVVELRKEEREKENEIREHRL